MTLAGGDQLTQGTYGLFFVSLVLLAIAQFAGNDGLGKVGGGSGSLRGCCLVFGDGGARALADGSPSTGCWSGRDGYQLTGSGMAPACMRHTWGPFCFVGLCGRWGLVAQFLAPLKAKGVYSTVTDFARFLGLSMSRPRANAVW